MNNYELHKAGNSLRDVILGGQDGLVNALGIILGILILTVIASLFDLVA